MKENSIINFKMLLKYFIEVPTSYEYLNSIESFYKDDYIKSEIHQKPDNYIKVWNAIKKYHKEYSEMPSYETLRNHIVFSNVLTTREIDSLYTDIKKERLDVFRSNSSKFITNILEQYTKSIASYSTLKYASDKINKIKDDFSNSQDINFEIYNRFDDITKISFDFDLGMTYEGSAGDRWDLLHSKTNKIPSCIDMVNKYTFGGYEKKKLHILMARTHLGKTMWLVSELCDMIRDSSEIKLAYVTLEISEQDLWQRMEWNLSGLTKYELMQMSREEYIELTDKINKKYKIRERVYIKEFATGSLTTSHLRSYLDKLKKQKGFTPDVLAVDYISIMKGEGDASNSYFVIGNLGKDLRGITKDYDLCCLTCMQTNRKGQNSKAEDIDFDEMADSASVSSIADVLFGGYTNERLKNLGRVAFKFLKNRYSEHNGHTIYPIADYPHQSFSLDRNDDITNDENDGLASNINKQEVEPKKYTPKRKMKFGDYIID